MNFGLIWRKQQLRAGLTVPRRILALSNMERYLLIICAASVLSISLLIITLIRLWGQSGASQCHKKLLENFMALVSVFRWAPTRSTSEHQIQVVEHQLQKYYKSLMALSGKEYMTPSHHMSLHLPECLREFGPIHGWWGFAFERYNGIIQ